MATAVIVDIIRTPSGKGKPGGALSGVHPADLLAQTLTALVERNGLDTALVDDVIAGCVGQVGDQSLNIAPHRPAGGRLPGVACPARPSTGSAAPASRRPTSRPRA